LCSTLKGELVESSRERSERQRNFRGGRNRNRGVWSIIVKGNHLCREERFDNLGWPRPLVWEKKKWGRTSTKYNPVYTSCITKMKSSWSCFVRDRAAMQLLCERWSCDAVALWEMELRRSCSVRDRAATQLLCERWSCSAIALWAMELWPSCCVRDRTAAAVNEINFSTINSIWNDLCHARIHILLHLFFISPPHVIVIWI